jgi:hypothetical protein
MDDKLTRRPDLVFDKSDHSSKGEIGGMLGSCWLNMPGPFDFCTSGSNGYGKCGEGCIHTTLTSCIAFRCSTSNSTYPDRLVMACHIYSFSSPAFSSSSPLAFKSLRRFTSHYQSASQTQQQRMKAYIMYPRKVDLHYCRLFP